MKILLGLVILAVSAAGQEYRKHNITVDMGAGLPRGELRPLFSEGFLVSVGYGYRFLPYLQADVGFDTVIGAADVRDFLPTPYGNLRIRDYQHFVPFGGRAILPFANERFQIYGGGGGAYMRYSERVRQPFAQSGFIFDCDVCSSRDGWGYYATAGVNFALDRARMFRVGLGTKVIRGETEGDPFGAVRARRTDDQWVNVFGSFTISF